jgi:hypothetical protein
MKKNEPGEKSIGSNEQSQSISNQDAATSMTSTTSSPLSRRSFFGRVGASTAVAAAAGVGLPSMFLSEKTMAGDDDDRDGDDDNDNRSSRRGRSFQIRRNAAIAERKVPVPPQIANGDEERYPNLVTTRRVCPTTASVRLTRSLTKLC